MPLYEFKCTVCGIHEDEYRAFKQSDTIKVCVCGAVMDRVIGTPMILGTRDSFGVKKSFIDDQTGKEITTWKEWERAGYKPAGEAIKDTNRSSKAKTLFKEKLAKKQNTIQV